MTGPITSRSQRRREKRQAVMLLAIILAVALTSFVLGVMVGRKGDPGPMASQDVGSPRLPVAASPPAPAGESPPPEISQPEKLSFYETLPRGETQPLGSGINLPEQAPPVAEPDPKPTVAAKPERQPPPATPGVDRSPGPDPGGAYLVQAASFRQIDEARIFQKKLAAKDFPAYVEKTDLGPKGVWFRVLAGPFKGSGQAQEVAARLKDEFRITPLVKKR